MSTHFLDSAANRLCLLQHCRFREFVILIHLRHDIRAAGLNVLAYRVRRRLAVNLGGTNSERRVRVDLLLDLMDGEDACIVGSTVQSLICFTEGNEGNLEGRRPPDLNILTDASKAGPILELLKSFGMYCVHERAREEYQKLLSCVYVCRGLEGERNVTVSCTYSPRVLATLLASTATSQMNALSREHLLSFYPRMTMARFGLLAWPAARMTVQEELRSRCTTMMLPFFPTEDLAPFWAAMNNGRGGITGSGPLWVSQTRPSWRLQNLNAVVGRGRAEAARAFFAGTGWKELSVSAWIPEVNNYRNPGLIPAHDEMSAFTDRTWHYSRDGRPPVTLTETADISVFRHIASARHSMATMLLTSTALIALHPDDCIAKVCYRRGSWAADSHVLNALMARVTECGGSDTYLETINGPCGRRCPGLLRRLRGGKSVGLLLWKAPSLAAAPSLRAAQGQSDADIVGIDAYGGFAHEEYALGWTWATCVNTACETFLFPRNCVVPIASRTAMHTNPKMARICRIEEAIQRCIPAFPRLYKAILFPTCSDGPVMVSVPLDHGIDVYHSIDDLRTQSWIAPRIRGIERYPVFMPRHNLIGATTVFNALCWREDVLSMRCWGARSRELFTETSCFCLKTVGLC
ncbi:hypothetical protein B0H16DRAFT_1747382 [Mycena metata]|uniref:Uncharacterized protein n=1 Tax=Mycena metata TaxID=1033252 RepID=A0AAD7GU03_9AGAR|nr:hypothetical protein B0H16DRAFT_1747382 [Mycena metata]